MAQGELRFLADLNISPLTVEDLRAAGWEVSRVNQHFRATTADEEILTWAHENHYVIVTQDLDFSALIALRGWNRPSLLTLRLTQSDPATVTARLREILPGCVADLSRGSAVTVGDQSVRIRRLPIL